MEAIDYWDHHSRETALEELLKSYIGVKSEEIDLSHLLCCLCDLLNTHFPGRVIWYGQNAVNQPTHKNLTYLPVLNLSCPLTGGRAWAQLLIKGWWVWSISFRRQWCQPFGKRWISSGDNTFRRRQRLWDGGMGERRHQLSTPNWPNQFCRWGWWLNMCNLLETDSSWRNCSASRMRTCLLQ